MLKIGTRVSVQRFAGTITDICGNNIQIDGKHWVDASTLEISSSGTVRSIMGIYAGRRVLLNGRHAVFEGDKNFPVLEFLCPAPNTYAKGNVVIFPESEKIRVIHSFFKLKDVQMVSVETLENSAMAIHRLDQIRISVPIGSLVTYEGSPWQVVGVESGDQRTIRNDTESKLIHINMLEGVIHEPAIR